MYFCVSIIILMSFFGQAFARELKDGVAISVSLEETVVAQNVTQLLCRCRCDT